MVEVLESEKRSLWSGRCRPNNSGYNLHEQMAGRRCRHVDRSGWHDYLRVHSLHACPVPAEMNKSRLSHETNPVIGRQPAFYTRGGFMHAVKPSRDATHEKEIKEAANRVLEKRGLLQEENNFGSLRDKMPLTKCQPQPVVEGATADGSAVPLAPSASVAPE